MKRVHTRDCTYSKLLVQLIGEKGVGELSEVQFTQGGNTVDILHVDSLGEIRNNLTVKFMTLGGEKKEKRKRLVSEYRAKILLIQNGVQFSL